MIIFQFFDEYFPILEMLNRSKRKVILAGDYNIDLLKINEKHLFSTFHDTLLSYNYIPKITLPTQLFNTSATLIDDLFCNLPLELLQSRTATTTPISDHLPYFILLNCNLSKPTPPKFINITKITPEHIENFKQNIVSADLVSLINTNEHSDPNISYNLLHNALMKSKDKCLPTKHVKFRKNKHKGSRWITLGIIKYKSYRDKLFVTLKKD